MTPAAFEAQLTRLLVDGYEGMTFTAAVRGGAGRRLAVTFDDAFASVLEIAKPILDRLGIPATVFAVTDFAASGRPLRWDGIDHWAGGRFDAELRGLDWTALRALAAAGWEVGSHTCDHPHLTRCDDAELRRQLAGARAAYEAAMGAPCPSIAYPYGDVDERVERATAEAGYPLAAALPARWYPARALAWPRVGIWHGDSLRRFGVKTSRTVRLARGLLEPRVQRRLG